MIKQFEVGQPDSRRWYILIMFGFVSAFQCNTWFTFSSCPNEVEDYYHLSNAGEGKVNSVIDLLLNWGPIIFMIVTPFTAYILSYPMVGLQFSVRLAVTILFIANFCRCIPCMLASNFAHSMLGIHYEIDNDFWHTLIFLHSAQILNAIAGPLVMGPPSKLSVIWFPTNERSTATGIAALSNTCGYCFGFLMGPLMVKAGNDIPLLLYTDLALAFIPFVFIWMYFPMAPKMLPSIAAKYALLSLPVNEIQQIQASSLAITAQDESEKNCNSINIETTEKLPIVENKYFIFNSVSDLETDDSIDIASNDKFSFYQHLKNCTLELKVLFQSKSAILLIIAGGMQPGMFAAWTAVLQDMLSPIGLSATQIGFIGFDISLMLMVGGLISGPLADRYFVKQLKKLLLIFFIFMIFAVAVLLFIMPSPFYHQPLIIINDGSSLLMKNLVLHIFCGFVAFFDGALIPMFYELTVECAFPCSEGTSIMLLVYINNVACFVFVGIGNWLNTRWETLCTLIVCCFSFIFILAVKEKYHRK